MDRVKIDIPASVYDEWMEAYEIYGQKIMVRKRISYDEMVEFATEYAQHCCVIDEDAQVAYEVHEQNKIMDYLTLKYYTNVELDDQEDPMAYASNLMGLLDRFSFLEHTNISNSRSMAMWFVTNTLIIYERYHSLGTKALKAFGGVLNGGDLVKELAESQGLSERILDAMQGMGESEKSNNIMLFKQFAKKPE